MSLSKRAGLLAEISASLAMIAASSPTAAVPPSSESRSSASAPKPLAAKRPATLRMWSVRPRFSWITSTPPLTLPAGGAHAPISVTPLGPGNVIGCGGDRRPRGDPAVRVAVPVTVVAAFVLAAGAGLRLGRDHRRRRGRAHAEHGEPPHRLPPRDDPVDVVLRDLLCEVPLELRHVTSPGWLSSGCQMRAGGELAVARQQCRELLLEEREELRAVAAAARPRGCRRRARRRLPAARAASARATARGGRSPRTTGPRRGGRRRAASRARAPARPGSSGPDSAPRPRRRRGWPAAPRRARRRSSARVGREQDRERARGHPRHPTVDQHGREALDEPVHRTRTLQHSQLSRSCRNHVRDLGSRPRQAVRLLHRAGRPGPRGRRGRGPRLPRPQRRGQVDHDPRPARAPARRRRRGHAARRRPVARRDRAAPPAGLRARRRHALAEPQRRRGDRPARPPARRARRAAPRGAARSASSSTRPRRAAPTRRATARRSRSSPPWRPTSSC